MTSSFLFLGFAKPEPLCFGAVLGGEMEFGGLVELFLDLPAIR
ncbi:hypothetical protein SLEP1_g58124 [Rubroshorea leprosula]|uniref:Uncharacterized protein n=1 Tax=Rubroshorea leprosula TaxID=152421 RepID=A0AAV5MN93_9ROSI|nr:hypothetical protein SLEP1_g58124 [Rubroshorea leprosula]